MALEEEFSVIYEAYINYLQKKLARNEIIEYAHFKTNGNPRRVEKIEDNKIFLYEVSENRRTTGECDENELFLLYKYSYEKCKGDTSIIANPDKYQLKILTKTVNRNFKEFKKAIFIDLMQFKPLAALEREQLFNIEIESFKRLTKAKQEAFQEKANPKPEKIIVQQIVFKRNPFVVIKVLERAKGICERCLNKAPFIKDNGDPYLEVHHKKPLSEDGDDTIDNCIALCPNCHRHAHYGKGSY